MARPDLKLIHCGHYPQNLNVGEQMKALESSTALALTDRTASLEQQPELADLVEPFLRYSQVRLSTQGTYKRILRLFLLWINGQGITSPDRATILDWLIDLEGRGVSPATRGTYLTVIKAFFKFLSEDFSNGTWPNIAQKIKAPRRRKTFSRGSLTEEETRVLLQTIQEEGKGIEGLRDYALVCLIVGTGRRSIEMVRADIGHLDTEQGFKVLRIWGKGRDQADELVKLESAVYEPLRKYLGVRGAVKSTDPLFIGHGNRNRGRLTTRSIRGIVARWLICAGLKRDNISCHSLRHTFAMIAKDRGAPIEAIRITLHHASIETTTIYFQSANRLTSGAESFVAQALIEA